MRRLAALILSLLFFPAFGLSAQTNLPALEKQVEQNIAAGMSPKEARYAALRSFGGVEQVKEECRDAWGVRVIDTLLQDIRFGLRQQLGLGMRLFVPSRIGLRGREPECGAEVNHSCASL